MTEDRGPCDAEFARDGCKQGVVPEAECTRLIAAFRRARPRLFDVGDCLDGYVNGLSGEHKQAEKLNLGTVFLGIDAEQRAALTPILSLIERPVRACLGTPWQVVNTRCWKTRPDAVAVGPNEWHVDGFPDAFMKILLYLSPVGSTVGTTEVVTPAGQTLAVNGPPGSWLLFRNGRLLHRGVVPSAPSEERTVVELTISSALGGQAAPIVAGLNAKYPRYPWLRPDPDTIVELDA